jgi:hypothetical protein
VPDDLGKIAVCRSAKVDRRLATTRRDHPRSLEELLASANQVVGAGADLLRVDHQDVRSLGQDVREQLQLADAQDRDQRLHALDRNAAGQFGEHLG